MNLADYLTALQTAKTRAVESTTSYIIRYYPETFDFLPMSLQTATVVGGWEVSTIAASVDHNGIVTESKWIKDKQEVAA